MRFSYQPYEVDPTPASLGASIVYRPVIPVRFIGQAGSATIWSLVDTGADGSYITEEPSFLTWNRLDPRRFGSSRQAAR